MSEYSQDSSEPIVGSDPTIVTPGGTAADPVVTGTGPILTPADDDAPRSYRPLISWGAIFAGVFTFIGLSYLLYLLGLAMGVSIADVSEGAAFGNGLAIGAIVWMVLSALLAYFVGSLVAARLSNNDDDTAGMLHGLTLWSVATTLLVLLSYLGVSSLLQTGLSLTQSAAGLVGDMGATAASAVTSAGGVAVDAGQAAYQAGDTKIANNIQARLKRRAASVVAKADAEGGTDVSQSDVRSAIESLDSQSVQAIAGHLIAGEMTAAREELTSQSELSDAEAKEILQGLEQEFSDQFESADGDPAVTQKIENAVTQQTGDFIASLDADGGATVRSPEVQKALEQITPETLQKVSMQLIAGDVQGAKDVMATNTNLSTRQINDIVSGVNDDVSRTVQRYQEQAAEAVEAASTYAQGVLWTAFVAAAMGLAVSILGGYLGAEATERHHADRRRRTIIE